MPKEENKEHDKCTSVFTTITAQQHSQDRGIALLVGTVETWQEVELYFSL